MPFRRFRPGRGYYELLSWKQALLAGLFLLGAVVLIIILLLRPRLFPANNGSSSSPVAVQELLPEQQSILDAANCIRQEAGLPLLSPDMSLMATRYGSGVGTMCTMA